MGPATLDEAREALRLAEASPEHAVALAARVARQARRERHLPAGAVAERAWGLALRHRGDLDSAIAHLQEAVRLGRRSGSARLAGEARITLSFALFERGRTRRGLAEIDAAVPRLRRLGPVAHLDDLLDRIPFALHRIIRGNADPDSIAAAFVLLDHARQRLDALLMAPLPEIGDRPIVLVPTGPLQRLPWSLLPSCAGRPVTVAPSATLWHAVSSRPAGQPGHVLVAAGPSLPGANEEARAVAAIHRVPPLLHPAATVQAVKAALDGAALAHLAAHGRLSAQNPLFSDLLLSDGPLLAYDLERIDRPPHTVVLAACDSAQSVVCAGDELLGLSATFLTLGTTQLVASVLPVLDAETAPVMAAFHRLVAAGQPPAVALAAAQQQLAAVGTAMASGAGFVCLGAGFSSPALCGHLDGRAAGTRPVNASAPGRWPSCRCAGAVRGDR